MRVVPVQSHPSMNTPSAIRIERIHTYAGPSIFAREPVVVARLVMSPEVLANAGERIKRMSAACRAWFEWPHEQDTPTALDVGKFLAHWSRCALIEPGGYLHVAEAVAARENVLVILGYHDAHVSFLALEVAATIFADIDRCTPEDVAENVNKFWNVCQAHHPDYQAVIMMTAARAVGIPVLPFMKSARCWQYGWGAHSRVFFESASTSNSQVGNIFSGNKSVCKAFFHSLGIPTPVHVSIAEVDELPKALETVGYPCVVKPVRGSKGKGVTAGIDGFEDAEKAFHVARRASAGPVLVERFVAGEDHRLMVVDGKFIAAIRREPPVAVGDGQRTVRQLIEQLNAPRSANLVRSHYLRRIRLDDVVLECLRMQQVTPETVLAPGQRIRLRTNANLATGGVCIDVTEATHPLLKSMVEDLAAALSLPTCGFDYMTADISQSPRESGGAFIEANSIPSLDVPIAAGWCAEDIGRITLGEGVGRIPVSLFIAESPHAADEIPAPRWPLLARVVRDEVRIDQTVYRVDTKEPWAAVRAALRNRAVHALEIFCTRADIMAHGLPVDRLDRTVLLGVQLERGWQRAVESCSGDVEHRSLESTRIAAVAERE